jgi:hypothetical protein
MLRGNGPASRDIKIDCPVAGGRKKMGIYLTMMIMTAPITDAFMSWSSPKNLSADENFRLIASEGPLTRHRL